MLLRDEKTGRFLSQKESNKIIAQKKAEYDKQINELYKQETNRKVKETKKSIITKSVVITLAIVLVIVICFLIWR